MTSIGVVGAGAWGRNLLRNVASNARANLTAICDSDAAARAFAAGAYSTARIYQAFDDMLGDTHLDAVIIATPARLHFSQAALAIECGLHVLVEKPMCMTSWEAARLIALAESRNRVLMVGHTFLFSNLVHEVKRRIAGGELGDVLYIHSQRLNLGRVRRDVDALWNFAPHDVSIAGFLLDDWPVMVNARGASFVQAAERIADVALFQMGYDDGRFVSGHVSWLDPQKTRRMVVVGSKKMLVYDDIDSLRHIQIYDKSVAVDFQSSFRDFSDFRTRIRAGDLTVPNIQLVEPLAEEITHFAQCIQEGTRPVTDGAHGLRVVSVLEALSKSMSADGIPVSVSHLDDVTASTPSRAETESSGVSQPFSMLLDATL